jgi:threonine/homoserine/homoserine lactone efflux protein
MDGIVNFYLFLASAFFIIALPGQDFFYVLSRGVAMGKRAGVISAFGISVGILVHTLLAAFGLSVVIQASALAFNIIKYAGAGYLLFLGIKTLRSNGNMFEADTAAKPVQARGIFVQGVLTNVFNPKALIVFIAFLPQFIDGQISNPISQFLILGLILAGIAIVWFSIVGYFAGLIGSVARKNRFLQHFIKYASGLLLIVLGLRLAFEKR